MDGLTGSDVPMSTAVKRAASIFRATSRHSGEILVSGLVKVVLNNADVQFLCSHRPRNILLI